MPLPPEVSQRTCARTLGGQARWSETIPPTKDEQMNALKRWNQMKGLETFQHNLDSLLLHFPVPPRPERQEQLMTVTEWSPLVDISENDQEYLIKAELPEVRKEDVKVTAEKGTLTIMGERKFEKEDTDRKYHRVERAYGSFGRSFALPDDANPAKVSAAFKDGVLVVHLVKDEKIKPQQVEVKIS
jgi:HSP20 family protein